MPPPDAEPTHLAPSSPPEPEENFWTGPLGLRAGWGILLYLVLALSLGAVLLTGLFRASGQWTHVKAHHQAARAERREAQAAGRPAPPAEEPPLAVGLAETAEAGAVLLAGLVLSLVERRRFGVYGLGWAHLRDLFPGALVGLVSLGLLVGLLRLFGLLVFDAQLLHGAAIVRLGAAWLGIFVLVGLFEEFFFRGYLQFTLMRGLLGAGEQISPLSPRRAAFWIAALVWSLLFCLTHLGNAGEDPMGVVMVFVAGILFSYALWKTGSLWWGVGFHMTWDWSQSFLWGVPDSGNLSAGRLFATHPVGASLLSGGVAGPEGSLLVLPVLGLVALVLRLHPGAAQPALEPGRSLRAPQSSPPSPLESP